MRFGFTPEQEKWRDEVSTFFEERRTPEWSSFDPEREANKSQRYREIGRALDKELVERGWWILHWPKEYGGAGRDHVDQAILQETEGYVQAPTGSGHSRYILGPALAVFGTEEQKKKYLPKIARADLVACLGYTEPNAGSDLAAMQTRAVLDGNDYVINGHKTFISYAHFADVILLATRTDPTVAKHKGITLFLLDMDRPGIKISPLRCSDGQRTNDLYFEDLRVPRTSVVGVENRGFYHMATALNFERSGVRRPASYRRMLEDFIQLCKTTKRGGKPLSEDPFVRNRLADLVMDIEAWQMICWRVVCLQNKGMVPSWEASMAQFYRKEIQPKYGRTLWEIMNFNGLVEAESPWAAMAGRIERLWRDAFNTHAQGGRNMTRNVIGRRGLDLPRSF